MCFQEGRRTCPMCAFYKFVGDISQQVVIKASFVIGLVLGAEEESEMNTVLLWELAV